MVYSEKMVVVVKCGGKILREVDDNEILLPFGSEYSLYFKNLESRNAVVSVSIDGNDVLDGSRIIIPSNTEFELKGFLKNNNVKNKFKFIQKTNNIVKHRGDKIDDGLIRIEYAFEKAVASQPITWTYHYHTYPTFGEGPSFSKGIYDNTKYTTSLGDVTFSSTANIGSAGNNLRNCVTNTSVNNFSEKLVADVKPEEGITVKGSETNQSFNIGWARETDPSNTIIFKLRGTTDKEVLIEKPVTVKTKFKCETCGRLNKSSSKFCSECGTSLL